MIGNILPALIAEGEIVGAYNTPEYLRDVGSPPRHAAAERDLAAGLPEALNANHKRPAIFFDVDGVLNLEPGPKGALSPDAVTLVPNAGDAVRRARDARQNRSRHHQPPTGGARRYLVRRTGSNSRPARSLAGRSRRRTRPYVFLPASSRSWLSWRGRRAQVQLRVPQAGHLAFPARDRRASDRCLAFGFDRRQACAT